MSDETEEVLQKLAAIITI